MQKNNVLGLDLCRLPSMPIHSPKVRINGRNLILIQFLFVSNYLFAQGTANFSYTVTNNHVTITDLTTCNCSWYLVSYNYGDTVSGILNSSYYNLGGFNHYYRDPGTYTICAYLHNSSIGGCTCSDTFCQTVTITTQGTDCHAEYCYDMYFDTTMNMNVVYYYNLSIGDDSITTSFWRIEGAQALSWDIGWGYSIINVPYPPFLFIQTQSGCESAFVIDTVFLGNTCNLTNHFSSNVNKSLHIYPNPTQDKIFVGMNHIPQGAKLIILNSLGQEMYRKEVVDTRQEIEISLSAFPVGIYYLQVQSDDNIFTEKIVRE